MLLDNLCIIFIDLSTAALPHLNRLLADRSLNLLLSVIFHTRFPHGGQIADDPATNTFDMACAVGMSKLKVSYCGQQCVSPCYAEGEGSHRDQATEQGLRLQSPAVLRCKREPHTYLP